MILHALKIAFLFLFCSFGFILLLWFTSFVFYEIWDKISVFIQDCRRLYPDKVYKSSKKINLTKEKKDGDK